MREHPLTFVAAGVVLLVFGVYTRVLSLRSANWPVAHGVITRSEVRTTYGRERRRDPSYSADVAYQYIVDGTTYRGTTISYAKGFFDNASTTVNRYPQGSAVDVHYHPKDPATAVLDPGAGPAPGLALLAGLGCFGYAFWRNRTA
jgi:hypothetical protein